MVDDRYRYLPEALHRAFPDLPLATEIRILGEGFRSIAVACGGLVFRVGRNEAALAGYTKEGRLLPVLAPSLPVAIPSPCRQAGPSPDFPFGVIGYPEIPGISLRPETLTPEGAVAIAAGVAGFLVALHTVPLDALSGLDLPAGVLQREVAGWRDMILPVLRDCLTGDEYLTIVQWWDRFLADRSLAVYSPALIHGDLWYEHLLVDAGGSSLMGVIDFEAARIGDPAQDLATQYHCGAGFARSVVDAYREGGGPLDAALFHRIQALWELREFEGLYFNIGASDAVEVEDSVHKLRLGPILNPPP
jgi:aminoglycoside phosphotransferase (APT) family kinase protein